MGEREHIDVDGRKPRRLWFCLSMNKIVRPDETTREWLLFVPTVNAISNNFSYPNSVDRRNHSYCYGTWLCRSEDQMILTAREWSRTPQWGNITSQHNCSSRDPRFTYTSHSDNDKISQTKVLANLSYTACAYKWMKSTRKGNLTWNCPPNFRKFA